MTSTRSAFLAMTDGSGRTLPLVDADTGYACTELDLGYPTPREVTNNRPDADGVDDTTKYAGSRAVTANITAVRGTKTVDEINAMFSPYLVVSSRPELHYFLDSSDPDGPSERVLTLRPSNLSAPLSTPDSLTMQLSWTAPDPVAYGTVLQTVAAWANSTTVVGGRSYPLVYPRTYAPVQGTGVIGTMAPAGDLPILPTVRMFGPGGDPKLTVTGPSGPNLVLALATRLDPGDYVTVDVKARTAVLYTAATGADSDAMGLIDWDATAWLAVPAGVNSTVEYEAGSAGASTQAVVTWFDGYLT